MDHLAIAAGDEREALATAEDPVNIDSDLDLDGPPPLPRKSPKKKGKERVVRSDSGEDEQGPSSAPWSRQEVPGSRTYQVSTAELDPQAKLRTEVTRQILVEGGTTAGLDVFDSRIQERMAQLVCGLPAPPQADKETKGCAPVQQKGEWVTAQQTGASAPVQKQEGLPPRMRGQLSSPPAAVRDASWKRTRKEEDTQPVSAPPSLGSDGSPSGSQSVPSRGIAGSTRTRRRLNDGQVALQLQAIMEENPTIRLSVPLVEPTSSGIEYNRAFLEEEVDRIHNLASGLMRIFARSANAAIVRAENRVRDSFRTEKEEMDTQMSKAATNIIHLKRDVKDHKRAILELEAKHATTLTKLGERNTEVGHLQEKVDQYTADLTRIRTERAELRERNTVLEEEANLAKKDADLADSDLVQEKLERKKLKKMVAELQESLTLQESRENDMGGQAMQLENKLRDKIDQLKNKAAEYEEILDDNEELRAAEAKVEQWKRICADQKKMIRGLSDEIEDLKKSAAPSHSPSKNFSLAQTSISAGARIPSPTRTAEPLPLTPIMAPACIPESGTGGGGQ
ncbi:unnamed protein product [Calypogeia fissa]